MTNDAGELVRREHARDLGASVVVAVYRLARLAQMHDLGNQAFVRQLEQTHQAIGEYCLRSGMNVNVLFAQRAIFIAGQLLKGSRGTYEAATELAEIVEWCGGSELAIAREVTQPELQAFAEAISAAMKGEKGRAFRSPSPRIRLRAVNESARHRGIEVEHVPPEQRVVRSYASAVVVLRRFFDDLTASKYVLPRRIKRIAQSLVDLSEAGTAAFLGVTEARNQNHDAAGRAVNSAILAVAIAREIVSDKSTLAQIAMAAMVHDVGRPRAIALATAGGPRVSQIVARLSEDAEDRLPSGTAAVLTALGRVNEPSITRTVIAFEALWLRRASSLGPPYRGARGPTLHARIVAVARRYNDLLTPEPGLAPPPADAAIATLADELTEPADRTVLRALVAALGLLPVGTVVQLATGEVGEVVAGSAPSRPRVRVSMSADGGMLPKPHDVDLAKGDGARRVVRVMSIDGWKKALEGRARPGSRPTAAKEESIPSRSAVVPTEPRVPVAQRVPDILQLPSPVPPPPDLPLASIHPEPPSAIAAAVVTSNLPPRPAPSPPQTPPQPSPQTVAPPRVEKRRAPSFTDEASMGTTPSAVAEAMGRMIEDALRGAPVPHADAPISTLASPVAKPNLPTPPPSVAPDSEPDRRTEQPQTLAEIRAAAPVQPPPESNVGSTARGTLGTTPLAHVLVYMLDHGLTGSIIFEEPDSGAGMAGGAGHGGLQHVLHFRAGAVSKVRVARPTSRIGDDLVSGGLASRAAINAAVEGSRRLGVLIGEYLVGHDIVPREALTRALEQQIATRVASLVNLSPETTYSFQRDVDLLESIESEGVVSEPLNVILATVRGWHDRARIRATLARIAKHPLTFHPDADPLSLALTTDERVVAMLIRDVKPTTNAIFQKRVADEEVVSSLVYALAVTRQFGLKGQKKGPMGGRGAVIPISIAPPAPSDQGVRAAAPAMRTSELPEDLGRLSALPASPDDPPPSRSAWAPASLTDRPTPFRTTTSDLDNAERALEAMTHFRLAETALQRGDMVQAEKLAARAVAGDPDQADYAALHAWATALIKNDDAAATTAIDALSRVLLADGDNERALLYRGKLFKRVNRAKDALRDFERILLANPRQREAAAEARLLKQRAAK